MILKIRCGTLRLFSVWKFLCSLNDVAGLHVLTLLLYPCLTFYYYFPKYLNTTKILLLSNSAPSPLHTFTSCPCSTKPRHFESISVNFKLNIINLSVSKKFIKAMIQWPMNIGIRLFFYQLISWEFKCFIHIELNSQLCFRYQSIS